MKPSISKNLSKNVTKSIHLKQIDDSISPSIFMTLNDTNDTNDYDKAIKTRSTLWWSWWNWWFIEIIGVKFNGIFGGVGGGSKSQKKV